MKRFWLFGILLVAAGTFLAVRFLPFGAKPAPSWGERYAAVRMAGKEFFLEIAATPASRARGLAGRSQLAENGGMLFVFPRPDRYPFWMKGMHFPVDIFWLRGDAVISIVENASPPPAGAVDGELERFVPPEAADKVMETRAGVAEALGIRPGQRVEILLPSEYGHAH